MGMEREESPLDRARHMRDRSIDKAIRRLRRYRLDRVPYTRIASLNSAIADDIHKRTQAIREVDYFGLTVQQKRILWSSVDAALEQADLTVDELDTSQDTALSR